MTLTRTEWAVIRCTDGKEWIELGSIRCDADASRSHAEILRHDLPDWSRDNPVIRIARITITEVTP